ncbi:MAG: protein translocase subunit SecF [Patescibacteria group bacterium]|nr:protein translocase subunit SecF [Patescibacteria group bacterium]
MWIVNNRKAFYGISILLVAVSVAALAAWGVKPGIDFTGGTLVEVSYPGQRPDQSAVAAGLSAIDPAVSIRPSGSDGYFVRMKAVDQAGKAAVMSALSENGAASTTVKSFDSIGPVLGAEALRKAYVSILLVILGIVFYITLAFRKVSEPVSSWKYGMVAVIALAHDVIIPLGAFSILGHYLGYEVDTLFVTALLVILGFSVHNTIVVFDRVRENLRTSGGKEAFASVVGKSVSQTFTRSMNTSATVLIALIVLFILGSSTTAHFTLALIIGIVAGTYSSVFIGSPLLVTIESRQSKAKRR